MRQFENLKMKNACCFIFDFAIVFLFLKVSVFKKGDRHPDEGGTNFQIFKFSN